MSDVEITYPPELLPRPEPGDVVEVYVQDTLPGDGCSQTRLVWSSADESQPTDSPYHKLAWVCER